MTDYSQSVGLILDSLQHLRDIMNLNRLKKLNH
jgi:hypothetical protein